MSEIPPDFDWVTAQYDCSAAVMFGMLKALANQNVTQRNKQLGREAFKFDDKGKAFVVAQAAGDSITRRSVAMEVTTSGTIAACRGGETQSFAEYTLGIDGETGRCKLRRDGAEFDPWQVLKHGLDGLLFG